ncbi:MAG: P1 family peptidase [Chloroflexota bacterium]
MNGTITDVEGIKVGHLTNAEAATGCTVLLCEDGAVAGVDVRGAAPGTRETALLNPMCAVEKVHAILLTGGSAFGLDAATGVMRFLEEKGIGFDTGVAKVPIVPAAVLFDLMIGRADVRPDAAAGYRACQEASTDSVVEGSVGAGTGATVGKLFGPHYATKCGLGTASEKIGNGIVVGALVAVNAMGDVVDPESGKVIAGTRRPVVGGFADTLELMKGKIGQKIMDLTSNTTLAVVATNASLTKVEANKVAQMAQNGLALSIRPVHTTFDGDTVFALATGKLGKDAGDVNVIGAVATQVLARAVVRAASQATSLAGVPAKRDVGRT